MSTIKRHTNRVRTDRERSDREKIYVGKGSERQEEKAKK